MNAFEVFKRFKEGNVWVKCNTINDFNEFMQTCKAYNIRWCSDCEADKYRPNQFPCYLSTIHGWLVFKIKEPLPEIYFPAAELTRMKVAKGGTLKTIVLRTDGTTTTGTLSIHGHTINSDCARRNPADKPDDTIGFLLTLCRLLGVEDALEYGDHEIHDFGWALRWLKQGCKLTRAGWNGKGQYIQLASAISYQSPDGETVNADHKDIGNQAIAFVGTRGVQMGWLASQADMLAEDWNLIFNF